MQTTTLRAWPLARIDALSMMLEPATQSTASFVTWGWRFLLGHLMFRYTKKLLTSHDLRADIIACWILMAAAFAITFAGARYVRLSKGAAILAAGIEMAGRFPVNANHACLEAVVLVSFLLVDFEQPDQRQLLVAIGRWTVTLLMFHSGLQKLLHGEYFTGMYLATEVDDWRFQPLLKLLLPSEEFTRLLAMRQMHAEGPFFLQSTVGLALSNSVYVIELLVSGLLLMPKTRSVGALLGVIVIVSIEAVALELTFGFVTVNLLMLFFSNAWRLRMAIVSCLAYAGLLVAQWVAGTDAFLFV